MNQNKKLQYKHTYAKQIIHQNKKRIYNNKQQILTIKHHPQKPNQQLFPNEKPYKTAYEPGQTLYSKEETRYLSSYEDLLSTGHMIISKPHTNKTWGFKNQSVEYEIVKYDPYHEHKGRIPKEHEVEYYPHQNTIRLIGPNVNAQKKGPWIRLNQEQKHQKLPKKTIWIKKNGTLIKKIIKQLFHIPKNEIPMLLTENEEILCLPTTPDMARIGFVGKTGTGKTLGAHALIDKIHATSKDQIMIMNDDTKQFGQWTLKNTTYKFTTKLAILRQPPKRLPLVFLFPHTHDLDEERYYPQEKISIDFSIPFTELLKPPYIFFEKKGWNITKGSITTFKKLIPQIKKTRNPNKIMELINQNVQHKEIQNKLIGVFEDIFKEQIFNNTTKTPAWLTIHEPNQQPKKMLPFFAIMHAGAIPCLVTHNLVSKDYFPTYQKWIINKIFERQRTNQKKRTWLFFDELIQFVGKGKEKTEATESIRNIAQRGRFSQIGFIYTQQNYSELETQIQTNTNYLFCYAYNSDQEANTVKKDFDLTDTQKKTILNLTKLECCAMTKEQFIIYDKWGNKRKETGMFKGKILPPLSQHQKPK